MPMRLPRLIEILFYFLFLLFISSCSNNYKIDYDFYKLFEKYKLNGAIGITVTGYEGDDFYIINELGIKKIKNLPLPPKPSHQNPELISEGYNFLPENAEVRYTGPQLISPNETYTVASFIKRNTSLHPADSFVLINNLSNNIVFSYSFTQDEKFVIEGIAWSPDSDIFLLLTSKSWRPFLKNFLSNFTGHGVVARDYFLLLYRKNGALLLKKQVISNVVNGNARVVWTQQGQGGE